MMMNKTLLTFWRICFFAGLLFLFVAISLVLSAAITFYSIGSIASFVTSVAVILFYLFGGYVHCKIFVPVLFPKSDDSQEKY
jgi:hypothetical protein